MIWGELKTKWFLTWSSSSKFKKYTIFFLQIVMLAWPLTLSPIEDTHYIHPIFYCMSLFIYFPTTQLFHSTKIFKNQHAHNQKGYSWSLWCLGGSPVTRISICTYYSTLHSVDHKNPPYKIHKPKSSKSLWICGAWKWENLYSTNFNSTLFIVTTLPFWTKTIYLVESESYEE